MSSNHPRGVHTIGPACCKVWVTSSSYGPQTYNLTLHERYGTVKFSYHLAGPGGFALISYVSWSWGSALTYVKLIPYLFFWMKRWQCWMGLLLNTILYVGRTMTPSMIRTRTLYEVFSSYFEGNGLVKLARDMLTRRPAIRIIRIRRITGLFMHATKCLKHTMALYANNGWSSKFKDSRFRRLVTGWADPVERRELTATYRVLYVHNASISLICNTRPTKRDRCDLSLAPRFRRRGYWLRGSTVSGRRWDVVTPLTVVNFSHGKPRFHMGFRTTGQTIFRPGYDCRPSIWSLVCAEPSW